MEGRMEGFVVGGINVLDVGAVIGRVVLFLNGLVLLLSGSTYFHGTQANRWAILEGLLTPDLTSACSANGGTARANLAIAAADARRLCRDCCSFGAVLASPRPILRSVVRGTWIDRCHRTIPLWQHRGGRRARWHRLCTFRPRILSHAASGRLVSKRQGVARNSDAIHAYVHRRLLRPTVACCRGSRVAIPRQWQQKVSLRRVKRLGSRSLVWIHFDLLDMKSRIA